MINGKTRRRRLVTLEPIALKLLSEHPLKHGPVAPSDSTIDRWKHSGRKLLGFEKWPQDLLRHTAASYMLALHQSASKVALQLGNSEKILLTHYNDPVKESDCKIFWQCCQTMSANGILVNGGSNGTISDHGETRRPNNDSSPAGDQNRFGEPCKERGQERKLGHSPTVEGIAKKTKTET